MTDNKSAKKTKKTLSKEEQIVNSYQRGTAPQEIARTFQVSVEEVLKLTGNERIMHIAFTGDQIDDPGPHGTLNPGKVYKQDFTTH